MLPGLRKLLPKWKAFKSRLPIGQRCAGWLAKRRSWSRGAWVAVGEEDDERADEAPPAGLALGV